MMNVKNQVARLLMAVALTVGVSLSAFATDFPVLKVSTLGVDQKIALTIEGLTGRARLTLTDVAGVVLHTEDIEATALYRKLLNLRSLPHGQYKLLLESETQETIQPFEIGAYGVVCRQEDSRRIFAPTFNLQGRSLDLSMLASEAGNIRLSLVSAQGYVVYESTFKPSDHKLERRFDLSKLAAGRYAVNLSQGSRTWTKTIVVE